MRYILFSDYDGTLRQNDKIDNDVLIAIRKFRSAGNLFAVVTGRDYTNGYKMFKAKDEFPFDYIINSSGSYACDDGGKVVFSEKIDGNTPVGELTLTQYLLQRCMDLTHNRCLICDEKNTWRFHPDFSCGNDEYAAISDVKKITGFSSVHLLCDTGVVAVEVCDILKTEFGTIINMSRNGRCIDITPLGVDKASSIEHLIDVIGINKDCVWTVGDNYNDIPMIEKYHGCAIKSGVDDLKDIAEYVCANVAEVIEIILSK